MSIKATITQALEMAIVKIRAAEDIDWVEACDRAAELITGEKEDRDREVKRVAERLFNARFMSQLNKARKKVYDNGYSEGYLKAVQDYRIWYFCSVCGKEITIKPKSNSHVAIIGYLKKKGWAHAEYHKKGVSSESEN